MADISKHIAKVAAKRQKATHTVHFQKVQYGYWGSTPYNDKIKKIKVVATDESDARQKALCHKSVANAYRSLRNGDKVDYRITHTETH